MPSMKQRAVVLKASATALARRRYQPKPAVQVKTADDPATHTIVAEDEDTSSITDDVTWTSGDFEVITADNVRFLVPSYHLFSASNIWCDARILCSGNLTVALTDDDFETADVFRLFLILVTDGSLAERDRLISSTRRLVRFLVKWECRAPLTAVMMHLRDRVREQTASAIRVFIAGAAADDCDTCALAIRVAYAGVWLGPELVASRDGLGTSIWATHRWSTAFQNQVPDRYVSALTKALLLAGPTPSLEHEFMAQLCTSPRE